MKVSATPVRWLALAFVVYLFYKSPQAMSHILGDLGRLFVAIGNGLETAIDKVPSGHPTPAPGHKAVVHPRRIAPAAGAALAYMRQLVMPAAASQPLARGKGTTRGWRAAEVKWCARLWAA
jgi:hypothetical protein